MSHNPFLQEAEFALLRGDFALALRLAGMGLSLSGDDPDLLEMAGACAERLGEDGQAVASWARLVALRPSADVLNRMGLAQERLRQPEAAEAAYRRAMLLAPEDGSPVANLGLLLENLERFAEAEVCQRRAVALTPESAEIRANLGGLLLRLGQNAEAEACYRDAIRLDPSFAVAYSNLGVLLTLVERDAEAEACFREALALAPDYLQGQSNLAQFLLSRGRLAEGWPWFEERQQVYAGSLNGSLVDKMPCPEWRGEPLLGKAIVVMPEQGLGDELQFCRYLAWLKGQGAARVTLVCRPAQKRLFETLAGPDAVCDLRDFPAQADAYDYWVFLLSLPLRAGTTLENIPADIPYLHADAGRMQSMAPLLAGAGLRVGLVWRGNPLHTNDADRSLPALATLAPLWALAGVRYFSLQKPAPEQWPADQPLVDLAPAIEDMADTAALLAQLDLLVTVDSSVAHLAGALGVPCWILLPAYKTDWRWLLHRSDTPWYPRSRLFRQRQRGDWSAPVAEIVAALAEKLAGA